MLINKDQQLALKRLLPSGKKPESLGKPDSSLPAVLPRGAAGAQRQL
jgi:hypothetical protein